jgi:hypothetical protein
LHTTGYALDILRRYGSGRQAAAFQYELERLEARNLISWVREPTVIHITVSSQADTLVDALLEPSRSAQPPLRTAAACSARNRI